MGVEVTDGLCDPRHISFVVTGARAGDLSLGMANNDDGPRRPLLTGHAALVLLLSLLSGLGAAVLTVLAGHSGYEAALVGIGVAAMAVRFFDWLIQ